MESRIQEQVEILNVEIPQGVETTQVVPLNHEMALANFTEEERNEVLALADSIDVRKIENVLNYGANALKMTFDQCGAFLKDEKGSHADQEVIRQVVELSKKASDSYDDFLVLQEPNFMQRVLMKVFNRKDQSQTQKIQSSAITSYKLLSELKTSCDSWIEMLKEAMGNIESSALSDFETVSLVEKYIIAGNIAKKRTESELTAIQEKYQQTGLQQYSYEYDTLKEGYDTFVITLTNLEKSRVMYHLSMAQLSLIKKSNRDVQISIHTQLDNSVALIGQQLRNAVLNAKTREVLEGQKAISKFNDELVKEISKSIGITAEDSEKLIYSGFYSMEAAKTAVSTVINSCNAIKKTASEMLPKMKADMAQIDELMKQLEPCIDSTESMKIENRTPLIEGKKKLEF